MANRTFERANSAARARLATDPRAIKAEFVVVLGRIVVELSSGIGLLLNPADLEGLQGARSDDLAHIEISPSGYGLHFPTVDADIYLPAILEGKLGSAAFMAHRMGAKGGASRSQAKIDAARENGRRGGRPRKDGPRQQA